MLFYISYVVDELSYDRFNKNADRIVRVVSHGTWDGGSFHITGTSGLAAPALKNYFPEIAETVRINAEGGGIIHYDEKKLKADDILFTDKTFFKIFTHHFIAGNAETALSKPASIVLTKSLAIKLFGQPGNALSKVIRFEDQTLNEVTGVIDDVPQNSHFSFSALRSMPENFASSWDNLSLYTYLLLRKNSDLKQLENKLPAFVKAHINQMAGSAKYRMELQPLTSIHLHSNLDYELSPNGNIKYIYIFSIVAILILLIAMINYMNLATARATTRIKEVGVRKVTGSGRAQLMGMFMTEAILITLISASVGWLLIVFLEPLFNELAGKHLSVIKFGFINTCMILCGFSLLAGILSGIYPAMFLSGFKTINALKGEMGNQLNTVLFRKSLVVFQFTVTIVMIVASVVIYRQLQYVSVKDLGFNKERVLTFHLHTEAARQNIQAIKDKLSQDPHIEQVAVASNPIGKNDIGMGDYQVEINGRLDPVVRLANWLQTDAEFIPTMQIRLLQGRNFSKSRPGDVHQSVVVNETLVKDAGWKDPIGKRISRGRDTLGVEQFSTVIGVVKDFNINSLQHKIQPIILQLPQSPNEGDNLYVRISQQRIGETIKYLETVYRAFDNDAPFEFHFLDQNFAQQYQKEQKQGNILLCFTILAISIACLGLFGLVTFTARQRTKEIGIRKVLGASVAGIVKLLSRDLIRLIIIAIVIATPLAWWVMYIWLQEFAYRTTINWWIFALAGLLTIGIALLTISFQSIKAAIANPVKGLRAE
ncbi:MAG: FtsX-like permease family protein [Sphingobacteriaceae bacterium]